MIFVESRFIFRTTLPVGVNQMIPAHLRFMLIVREDVVRRSDFLVNRGSQLKDTVRQ